MFDKVKFGKPRTDAMRRRRHKRLYSTSKLPARGTGRRFTAEAMQKGIGNDVRR